MSRPVATILPDYPTAETNMFIPGACPEIGHNGRVEGRFRRARRSAALLGLALAALAAGAAAPGPSRVEVAPAKTSIYVGTITLTMPPFARKDGGFESTYTAKVFPYFFFNESGSLRVEISDAQLARLARAEPVDFTGVAVRADGTRRSVSGTATPANATSGRLKVRVVVSKRIELIFNTTYRFPDPWPGHFITRLPQPKESCS